MMKSDDIRNASFSNGLSGYNKTEVDNFLEKVEQDYRDYETYARSMKEKVTALSNEIEQYKASSDSLNNVLISAQQLADKIVEDAKVKAAEIEQQAKDNADKTTAEAKKMLENIDEKIALRRVEAEKQYAKERENALKEQEAIKLVTNEITAKQQASFDKLKLEIAQFKKSVIAQYKEQFELLNKLPEDIVMDASRVAKAIEYEMEKEAEEAESEPEAAAVPENAEEVPAAPEEAPAEEGGFVINIEETAEPEENGEADFSNDFFKQSK